MAGTDTHPAVDNEPAATSPSRYAAVWELFADWCAVTGHQSLPADPWTVLAFLAACPAAGQTQRRRVTAIDHHHTAAGRPAPGDHDDVRAAVGRPPREPLRPDPDRAVVATALRALPSHGWTRGLFGRRDRALLVLGPVAGVPYRRIAALTVADLTHDADTGVVTVTAGPRRYTVGPDGDPVLCPACALTRWRETCEVLTRHIATQALADHLRRATPVTGAGGHACRTPSAGGGRADIRVEPLFPPINQWGQVAFPVPRLSPHGVSRQARDLLAGHLPLRRDLSVADPATTVAEAPPDAREEPEPSGTPTIWAGRHADREHLADVADTLDEVERRAAELDRRVAALLESLGDPAPA